MRKTTKPKAKSEAIQAIEERLRAAGVPAHMFHVKRVPPQIEISILFGSDRQKTLVRSKVNSRDIDAAIGQCGAAWRSYREGMFGADDETECDAETAA
jgi:hypothetical protein